MKNKTSKVKFIVSTAHIALLLIFAVGLAECGAVLLADRGASDFSIAIREDSPSSVYFAARELQSHIEEASGAKLPVVHDFSGENLIILGENELVAGGKSENIPLEGYRIMSRDGSLFIFGPDTPDGERTARGGFSMGTLNGVYTFLEEYVGVRWLMPGEVGKHVPGLERIELPEIDIIDSPDFEVRELRHTGDRNRNKPYAEDVTLWHLRQRVRTGHGGMPGYGGRFKPDGPAVTLDSGHTIDLSHTHMWHRVINPFLPDLYEQHPEFFALRSGSRARPVGVRPRNYKMCTSNSEFVEFFAGEIVERFRDRPDLYMLSISPTDGRGYCECEECRALDEFDGEGNRRLTRRFVKYYNEVAELVSQEFPDRSVSGYVYQETEIPPMDPEISLHPNFFPVWAPLSNYGFCFYRPEQRKKWFEMLEGWSELSEDLAYYDLLNRLSQGGYMQHGNAPNPPGRENLSIAMPALKEHGVNALHLFGVPTWSHAAPLNYALARLSWNAEADVDEMLDDFFMKAYGEAGEEMIEIYDLLDEKMEEYYLEDRSVRYRLMHGHNRHVYAPAWSQVEEIFRRAEEKTMGERQKERLELFRDNMIFFGSQLEGFGLVSIENDSPFYMSREELVQLAEKKGQSLYLGYPAIEEVDEEIKRIVSGAPSFEIRRVPEGLREENGRTVQLRRDHLFIFQSDVDEEVNLGLSTTGHIDDPVQYTVFDAIGDIQESGTIDDAGEINFFVSAGTPYFLRLSLVHNRGIFRVQIPDIPHVVDSNYPDVNDVTSRGGVYYFRGPSMPLYFHVPEDVESFTIKVSGNRTGWSAQTRVYDPEGGKAALIRALEQHATAAEIKSGDGAGGVWKVEAPEQINDRPFYDNHVIFGEELSGYASFGPKYMLVPTGNF